MNFHEKIHKLSLCSLKFNSFYLLRKLREIIASVQKYDFKSYEN